MKDHQKQTYATKLTLFVGVALISILRVFKALLRLSIRHFREGGGGGKGEPKGKMTHPKPLSKV